MKFVVSLIHILSGICYSQTYTLEDFGIKTYRLCSEDVLNVNGKAGHVFIRVEPIFLFGYLNLTIDGQVTIPLNHSDRLFFIRRDLQFRYSKARRPCDVTVWSIPTYCSAQGYSYHSSNQRSVVINFQNITSSVPICYMFEFRDPVTFDLRLIHGDQASFTLIEQVNGSCHWRGVRLQDLLRLKLSERFVIDVPLSENVVFDLTIKPDTQTAAANWADPGGPFRLCNITLEHKEVQCAVPQEFDFGVTEDRAPPSASRLPRRSSPFSLSLVA
jgi:hypothetical protein